MLPRFDGSGAAPTGDLCRTTPRAELSAARTPETAPASTPAVCALAACVAVLATVKSASAQAPPMTRAVRVAASPVVDGEILGESLWAAAPAAAGFRQTAPDEGAPASEATEVRIVYTDEALYVGVVCFDREPGRIVVSESRRDASLSETDCFQFILDTYRDRQNGFVFGTNPTGLEHDGQVTREGEGGGPGSPTGFNLNWDGSWQVRTQQGDFGWSAEFAIPFRTLRYRNGDAQLWGINFQRNIRRRNETAYWAPLSRQFTLYRLSQAGALEGMEVPPQRNLKLVPYGLAEVARDYEANQARRSDADFGGDLKYSVSAAMTLDLTVNTDFAQVEADEQQINLDRFNLFFPEKRPFFLENAGFFTVGEPGQIELFFSRRIGIGRSGEIVPILGGGRLSGKVLGLNTGLLNMQTRDVPGITPANNFTVARLARELPSRSSVGAIFTNRVATGEGAANDDHNQIVGLDGRWGIGAYGLVAGFLSRTFTPGATAPEHAGQIDVSYDSPGWILSARYADVGEDFAPDVGFTSRSGYRNPDLLVFRRWRPANFLGLLELRPHVSYRGFWKPGGFHETGFLHLDNHWEWRNGYEVHTGVNFTHEGLRDDFEIHPGVIVPTGSYDHAEVALVAITNEGAPLSLNLNTTVGGLFGGSRVTVAPALRLRLGQLFDADLRWQHNDVDLPGGRFTTNLVRARLSYSFTPKLFVQALLQANDTIDNWSTNLRLGWLQTANAGLYVVYNENLETGSAADLGVRDRSLVVKWSYVLDLLR